MTKISTFIPVVAVALIDSAGRVLMQQRRKATMHGGLWEFPGGKIMPGETAEEAIIREIAEELDISLAVDALVPLSFASDPALPPAPRDPHVILLYTARVWQGTPRCLAADALGWFAPAEMTGLAMPPLDVPLAKALQMII